MGKSSKISDFFDKQDKLYDFRNEELKQYRKKAEKITDEKTIDKRFKKAKQKPLERKITKKKLDKRGKDYGEGSYIFSFEKTAKGKDKGIFRYVARNRKTNKIISFVNDVKGKSELQHKRILQKKLEKIKFNYEKLYIKEDTEPIKETDDRKSYVISYITYYRYGIIIYSMKDGRKYEIIYQDADSVARSVYVSYQRVIAEFKDRVLGNTGLTLEEWIYLSKTQKNLFVEGGMSYKRYKGAWKLGGVVPNPKLEYHFTVDFEEL